MIDDNFSFHSRNIVRYLAHRLWHYDLILIALVLTLSSLGFITLFSAGYSFPWRIESQMRNILVAVSALVFFSFIPIQLLRKCSLGLFIIGCLLLLATHFFGITIKGATRWLYIGVQIQPSEILKLALPMVLAWFYQKRLDNGPIRFVHHCIALCILAIPISLILKQPDLGTSILVAIAGLSVIYLAGLQWRVIFIALGSALLSLPIVWSLMYDYQRERVLTLLDPTSDPLGKGFHILQSLIAIGSGGFLGKGWLEGTQAHLDFIPERTSDFLFAVYSEEFGFIGNVILLVLYTLLIGRCFWIAAGAKNLYSRLLAGAIGTIFFTYTFVNIGMVSGLLPVVGVPLPFMSYGGTALLILGVCTGILLSINIETKTNYHQ